MQDDNPPDYPPDYPPDQLLEQLLDNSFALSQADLELKAAHQRGDELLRTFQTQMEARRRFDSRVQLGAFAIAIIAGLVVYLVYPDWLPEQLNALSSLIKHL